MVSRKLVCIIPARGGSKGIKEKNLQKINGISLIGRTIKTFLKSKYIQKVYVSSDSLEILKESELFGATGIKRSAKLSSDISSSEDVLIDFFKNTYKENLKEAVFAQCTSPLITTEDVDKAIEKFLEKDFDSLFSSSLFKGFIWERSEDLVCSGLNHEENVKRKRRQDINNEIIENGGFYIFKIAEFLKEKNRFFGKIGDYTTQNQLLEIDEENELKYARFLLKGKDYPNYNFKHLFLDFDGVLTDNKVTTYGDGKEKVTSSKEDSLGLSYLKSNGYKAYILSSEKNDVVLRRAKKLGIELFRGIYDKRKELNRIIKERNLKEEEIIYVGNDINDLGIFETEIFCCCPKDSSSHITILANYISNKNGGDGAVRDICETFFNLSFSKLED